MRVLVTGAAGFIGYHTCARLLADGHDVTGADNMSEYYEVALKQARLRQLEGHPCFAFRKVDLADRLALSQLFETARPERVVHLAAQPGVRYSVEHPEAYVDSNLVGFVNVLERCRHLDVQHLVFASSSSVYGANTQMPFSTHQNVDHPLNLYAATKKANELLAHSYSHLFQIPTTGLRFFTVYGPWGRPDMALFLFTRSILRDEPISVFGYGKLKRDFTYIDDIVEGVVRILDRPASGNASWLGHDPDPASSMAPYRLYNIGRGQPVEIMQFVKVLEKCLGKRASLNLLPPQPGDVEATCADVSDLARDFGYQPTTDLEEGVERFALWYRDYYGV